MNTLEKKLDYLLAIYITAIIAAELLGSKFITLFGVATSVGIFSLPFTFVINDVVTEVVGKERARNFVRSGLYVLIFLFLFVVIARELPSAGFYKNDEIYRNVFGNSLRIIIASLTAFAVSEFTDVYIFNAMRKKWGQKLLWLRTNLSNFLGQLIDTTVFIFIAFYLVTPAYDLHKMLVIIIPYWLLKMFFSVIETPFCYLGVKWLKKENPMPLV
jgi:queuosine precursor transporter